VNVREKVRLGDKLPKTARAAGEIKIISHFYAQNWGLGFSERGGLGRERVVGFGKENKGETMQNMMQNGF
jgi:hypothetical protein